MFVRWAEIKWGRETEEYKGATKHIALSALFCSNFFSRKVA